MPICHPCYSAYCRHDPPPLPRTQVFPNVVAFVLSGIAYSCDPTLSLATTVEHLSVCHSLRRLVLQEVSAFSYDMHDGPAPRAACAHACVCVCVCVCVCARARVGGRVRWGGQSVHENNAQHTYTHKLARNFPLHAAACPAPWPPPCGPLGRGHAAHVALP